MSKIWCAMIEEIDPFSIQTLLVALCCCSAESHTGRNKKEANFNLYFLTDYHFCVLWFHTGYDNVSIKQLRVC